MLQAIMPHSGEELRSTGWCPEVVGSMVLLPQFHEEASVKREGMISLLPSPNSRFKPKQFLKEHLS